MEISSDTVHPMSRESFELQATAEEGVHTLAWQCIQLAGKGA